MDAGARALPSTLLGIGAAIALSLLLATAPMASVQCPHGTLTATHPHGCISERLLFGAIARQRGLAAHAGDLTSDLLYPPEHAPVPAHGSALARKVVGDLGATFPKLLRADANGPPYPTGGLGPRNTLGRVANTSISQTVSGPGGFTATGTGQLIDARPGQTGEEISISVGARVGGTGASANLSQGVSMGAFADLCPDSNGEVDGSGVARADMSGGFTAGSKAASFSLSVDGEYKLHGAVGDDGKLIDYSLVYDGTSSYDGPSPGLLGIGHFDAHFRAHMHMAFDHLRIGVPISDADFDRQFSNYTTSGFGPAGFLSGAYKHTLDALATFVWIAKHDADEALTKAQYNWYDNAACLNATFDPNALQDVPPSSTHDVAVTITATRDGQPVSMPVTLSASTGKVTPTAAESGVSPIQARLTVSDKPNDTTTLRVDGVSSRGRLASAMTATTAANYTVVYMPSSTAKTSYSYNHSTTGFVDMGTYSEQRNLAMTATVPTTRSGPGQAATGNGSLTWTRRSWTTDDNNTSTSQAAVLCTIDYKTTYTAFTPGTLQIRSLTVGTPGPRRAPNIQLDVIVNGVGEHYHLSETPISGPCPGFPSDGDTHDFESELFQMHQAVGDTIKPVGQGFELQLNGGWRPGTGDVVATRTVSWSHQAARPGGPGNAIRDSDTFQIVRAG
jgi:hypothetical protein